MTQKTQLMNWMEKSNKRGQSEFVISTLRYEEGYWWVQNFAKDSDPGGSFWEAFPFNSWKRILH